jgi:hypothetical protein
MDANSLRMTCRARASSSLHVCDNIFLMRQNRRRSGSATQVKTMIYRHLAISYLYLPVNLVHCVQSRRCDRCIICLGSNVGVLCRGARPGAHIFPIHQEEGKFVIHFYKNVTQGDCCLKKVQRKRLKGKSKLFSIGCWLQMQCQSFSSPLDFQTGLHR